MSPIIGFALLLLVFSINIFLPLFNFYSLRKYSSKNLTELQEITKILSGLALICAIISQSCLIYSFIISDYSIANIYKNSHHLKPLIYRISGSWGNHEGSMLLLISIISAYSFVFSLISKIDLKNKLIISSSQSTIIALLTAFTAFTSNPFERIFPPATNGLGLNPLLQDIGLALHPPMLYTGYIGFSLIFSFAIAGLINEKIDQKFAKYLKSWLFFSYGFLTLGIGLGSWWAYRELGWGGYWFWDPVENVSLMPWIAATTLIHCLKILEKKEIFKIWTAFLAILTFILCLLGIFLVRSGVLTSVHSFAVDAKRGFFVIAILAIIGGISMLILGNKLSKLAANNSKKISPKSKIGTILLNNYFLMIALFVILLGTTYPIFLRGFFEQFIAIGADYYNKIFGILLIPLLIFFAVSHRLYYIKNTPNSHIFKKRLTVIFIISTLIAILTFIYHHNYSIIAIILFALALFSAFIILDSDKSNITMTYAHFGFSLIIIGIILSSYLDITKEINLKKGQSFAISNYHIEFNSIEHVIGKNFIARQGVFKVMQHQKEVATLNPQLRYYPISEQTTNEAAIKHNFSGDLYLVIGNKDNQDNYAVRSYYKPFICLIWIGCFLIFLSSVIKITKILTNKCRQESP